MLSMNRIEPTIGNVTLSEPTPAEVSSIKERNNARALYARLLGWLAAMLVFVALLVGFGGYLAYSNPASVQQLGPYQLLWGFSALFLVAAYLTSYGGWVGLTCAFAAPALLVVLNLLFSQHFAWIQLFPVFMAGVAVYAFIQWRRGRI